ncbi:MAG: hypothetical protein RL607_1426 [Bacteroidota bacterium]|jgi:hypothetical protein
MLDLQGEKSIFMTQKTNTNDFDFKVCTVH